MKQTVVITGLAQGMGRETALLLAKSGTSIAGFDMDATGIESLGKELDAAGCEHHLEVMDITKRPEILKFRDRVLDKFGHVDVVLSNAGVAFFSPFEEVDLERALKCLEINVLGCAAIFQAFLPSMRERGKGKLVAVSSMVGQIPFPFESIYCASKFAVEGMVNSMRLEVEPFGIKVALIQPAQVSTKFAAKSHALPTESSPYRKRAEKFTETDHELIKSAPTPQEAAKIFVKVIKSSNPPINTQLDSKGAMLAQLNKILPTRMRDNMLLGHMGIK